MLLLCFPYSLLLGFLPGFIILPSLSKIFTSTLNTICLYLKIYPKSCYLYFLLLYPGPNHHHLPLRFLQSPSNWSLYSSILPLTGYSQNSGQKGPGRDIFQIMQCLLKTLQWFLIPLQAKISFTSADRRCFSHLFFFLNKGSLSRASLCPVLDSSTVSTRPPLESRFKCPLCFYHVRLFTSFFWTQRLLSLFLSFLVMLYLVFLFINNKALAFSSTHNIVVKRHPLKIF